MQQPQPTVKEYCLQQHYSDRVIDGGILYLVGLWERTAARVVDYRHWCRDDYLNDLDARQIFAELLPLATEAELAKIRNRVASADAEFLAHSVDAPSCVWGLTAEAKHQFTRQQHWWYYRMPQQIGLGW